MKHEQTSCRPTRKRTRQNEVWHFIIRDEGPEQQTMHFNRHASMSSTVNTIAGVRCSMRRLPQTINSTTPPKYDCSFYYTISFTAFRTSDFTKRGFIVSVMASYRLCCSICIQCESSSHRQTSLNTMFPQ